MASGSIEYRPSVALGISSSITWQLVGIPAHIKVASNNAQVMCDSVTWLSYSLHDLHFYCLFQLKFISTVEILRTMNNRMYKQICDSSD